MLSFNDRITLMAVLSVVGGMFATSCLVGCAPNTTPCGYLYAENLEFLLEDANEVIQRPDEPKGTGMPIRLYRLFRIREMMTKFGVTHEEAWTCMDWVLGEVRPTVALPSPDDGELP